MKNIKIAIVGATGLVGQKILEVLLEEGIYSRATVTLFVSEKSAGKVMYFNGECLGLVELSKECASQKFDIVFFSAGEKVGREYAHIFAEQGAYVIDNSNAFRRDSPLIVPEINADLLAENKRIIANPNCSSIELAIVLARLLEIGEIEQVVVSTYQSVSGAGKDAIADLANGTNNYFKKGIKNNVIAEIGVIDDNGNSEEENKIMFEINKILGTDIKVVATAVRVPVCYCHGESVYVKFKSKVNFEDVKNCLNSDFTEFLADKVCLNSEIANTNKTCVCRLRKISENEIALFIMADNLRRGASYNAVKIAEHILQNFTTLDKLNA